MRSSLLLFFFFQAEDGIRDVAVTGVQTCALPISWRTGERGNRLGNGFDSNLNFSSPSQLKIQNRRPAGFLLNWDSCPLLVALADRGQCCRVGSTGAALRLSPAPCEYTATHSPGPRRARRLRPRRRDMPARFPDPPC